MLRICTSMFPDTTFTWGSLVWLVVDGPPTLYESPPESKAYMTCKSQVKCTKSKNKPTQSDPSTDVRWTLISTTTMWFIWKRRCGHAFEGTSEAPAEMIMAIWIELIHNLQGQLQDLQGDTEIATKKRKAFYVTWDSSPFYTRKGEIVRWTYRPHAGFSRHPCREMPLFFSSQPVLPFSGTTRI